MEAIVILAIVVGLGVLVVRYGADSREGLRSKEQDLATYGMRWEVNDWQEPGDEPTSAYRQHWINRWDQPWSSRLRQWVARLDRYPRRARA